MMNKRCPTNQYDIAYIIVIKGVAYKSESTKEGRPMVCCCAKMIDEIFRVITEPRFVT